MVGQIDTGTVFSIFTCTNICISLSFFIVQHSKGHTTSMRGDITNGHSDVDLIISTCMGQN